MTKRKPRELLAYARRVDVDELKRLHAKGQTMKQMAERFGVHPRTISRNLNELGLTKPGPNAGRRLSDEWKAEAAALLEEGLSLLDVAATTGVSTCTMTRHFTGKGWTPSQVGSHGYAVRKANQKLRRLGHAPLKTTAA